MPRKQKNTADYFPHTATQGKTLFILKKKYGHLGYSVWFQLLEILTGSENHVLNLQDEMDREYVAAQLAVETETFNNILADLAKWGKLDPWLLAEKQLIWCQNLVDNLAPVYTNRKRNLPQKPTFSAQPTKETHVSTIETPVSTPPGTHSRVKESKVKQSINAHGEIDKSKSEILYGQLVEMMGAEPEKLKGIKQRAQYLKKGKPFQSDVFGLCTHLATKYPHTHFNGNLWDELAKWLNNDKRFAQPAATGNTKKPTTERPKASQRNQLETYLRKQIQEDKPLDPIAVDQLCHEINAEINGNTIEEIITAKKHAVKNYLTK